MKTQDRAKQWDQRYFKNTIKEFPLRVQKDLQSIPFPELGEIESTYFWGKIGSGKTIHAVFMMLTERKNNFLYKTVGKSIFITIPELLLEFKSSYDDKKITEKELVEKYSGVDLLVLDDFGVEKTTDWSFQLLYIIINRRYEGMKKTIFTSNLSLKELSEKLGDDRIPSRIQQMCKIVKSKNINYRVRK